MSATPQNDDATATPVGSPDDDPIIDAELVDESVGAAPVAADIDVTPTGYTDAGVPTFDYVQERIDARRGRAAGAAELDQSSAAGLTAEQVQADREKAAQERLAAIRKSMGG